MKKASKNTIKLTKAEDLWYSKLMGDFLGEGMSSTKAENATIEELKTRFPRLNALIGDDTKISIEPMSEEEELQIVLNDPQAIEKIAKNFSFEIFEEVGQNKLDKIVKLNERDDDPTICHSHDFMDSNMAMDAAMKRSGFDVDKESALFDTPGFFDVWNKAWAIAKENKFYHTQMAEIAAERESGMLSKGGKLDTKVLKAYEFAKANNISPLKKSPVKFDMELNARFEERKFSKDAVKGAYEKLRNELIENATVGSIPTKKGDIVKIKNPKSDENPSQLYVVVQNQLEEYGDDRQIECQALGTGLPIAPISMIEKKDLEVVMPAWKVVDAHAWMLEQEAKKLATGGEILKEAEHLGHDIWKKAKKEGKLLYKKASLGIKKVLHKKEDGGELDLEDIEVEERPDQENDCFISDVVRGGYNVSCGGKYIDHFDEMDKALECVNDWKEENKWWPTTWFVSDHGNAWAIDDEGNEIKYEKGGPIENEIINTVAKYGWTAKPKEAGVYELTNRKGISPAIVKVKGEKYIITDTVGTKLLSGNKDLSKAIANLLERYYYAQLIELPKESVIDFAKTS